MGLVSQGTVGVLSEGVARVCCPILRRHVYGVPGWTVYGPPSTLAGEGQYNPAVPAVRPSIHLSVIAVWVPHLGHVSSSKARGQVVPVAGWQGEKGRLGARGLVCAPVL